MTFGSILTGCLRLQFLLRGCNKSVPCLYHVGGGTQPYGNDAIEAVNVAGEQPDRVAAMLKRLAEYEATQWVGYVQVEDDGTACDKAMAQGWVLGPWLP